MAEYVTRDGDMLDWICHRHYGRTSEAVEEVLLANPGLADLGPVYDAGVTITLPDLPRAGPRPVVRLWT